MTRRSQNDYSDTSL